VAPVRCDRPTARGQRGGVGGLRKSLKRLMAKSGPAKGCGGEAAAQEPEIDWTGIQEHSYRLCACVCFLLKGVCGCLLEP
jgi:hypothetical protein